MLKEIMLVDGGWITSYDQFETRTKFLYSGGQDDEYRLLYALFRAVY